MGSAGRIANGVNTVHLAYVRARTGHALIGARQWIPAEHIADPVKSLVTGLPLDLAFRTKGQLAIDVLRDAYADGLVLDFVCGDEVYGSCTELREFLEGRGQAYVLRVASSFTLTLAAGTTLTCADAVKKLLKGKRGWEIRSAGNGSKGERWYAWAWIGTASPRHSLLVRRHLKTGELAFHYCFVPEGQLASKARLIRAAGLRWPVEESFRTREGLLRPGPVPGPGSTPRSCGTSCWSWPRWRSAPSPPPSCGTAPAPRHRPRQARPRPPPADPGLIPLTVREIKRLLSRSTQPRSRPATPPAGSTGAAATRHDHAGSTNAHASRELRPGQLAIGDCRTSSSLPVTTSCTGFFKGAPSARRA